LVELEILLTYSYFSFASVHDAMAASLGLVNIMRQVSDIVSAGFNTTRSIPSA
jgi:hypothetical protein